MRLRVGAMERYETQCRGTEIRAAFDLAPEGQGAAGVMAGHPAYRRVSKGVKKAPGRHTGG
jgi:hypothetical protein